ncbi:MAG TPA: hypothetical protein VEC14_08230 [Reyranellaceae bacterium]|nr:hypothetical protein [Reyranellaceae bacterium]
MFQLIATIATVACILWMSALQPAHASLKTGLTSSFAQPNAGAMLSAAGKLPEGFDFSETGREAQAPAR